jgi:hypothetical protein
MDKKRGEGCFFGEKEDINAVPQTGPKSSSFGYGEIAENVSDYVYL